MTENPWTPMLHVEGVTRDIREAMGAVSIALTTADHFLQRIFRTLTELEPEVAHFVVRDIKSNTLQKVLRDIARQKDGSDEGRFELLSQTLSRLSVLRDKRNQYLHWLWKSTEESLFLEKPGLIDQPIDDHIKPVSLEEIRETADEICGVVLVLFVLSRPLEEWPEITAGIERTTQSIKDLLKEHLAENGDG